MGNACLLVCFQGSLTEGGTPPKSQAAPSHGLTKKAKGETEI